MTAVYIEHMTDIILDSNKTKVIHVNRHFIAYNTKHGNVLPVYAVKDGSKTVYGHEVVMHGTSTLIDIRHHKPLKCGARAWIKTKDKVSVKDGMSYEDVMRIKDDHTV